MVTEDSKTTTRDINKRRTQTVGAQSETNKQRRTQVERETIIPDPFKHGGGPGLGRDGWLEGGPTQTERRSEAKEIDRTEVGKVIGNGQKRRGIRTG